MDNKIWNFVKLMTVGRVHVRVNVEKPRRKVR